MIDDLPASLISDASVLIDFAEADVEVLSILAKSFATLHVAQDVLYEVEALTFSEARRIGLQLCIPTVEELVEAAIRGGPLSGRDKLCLAIARQRKWGCLTNDHCLRRRCQEVGVRPIWGLEAMLLAHRRGDLSATRAIKTAQEINRINSHHINSTILAEFIRQIRALDS